MTTNAGRPLRALSLLGAALAGWVIARLPTMAEDMAWLQAAAPLAVPAPVAVPVAAPVTPAPPPQIITVMIPTPQIQYLPAPRVQYLPAPPANGQPFFWNLPPNSNRGTDSGQNGPKAEPKGSDSGQPRAASGENAVAGGLAAAAYARLAAGNRREAVALFDAALAANAAAASPDDRAKAWARDRRALTRRWSGDFYTLIRNGGSVGPAATPILGGGQTGGTIIYTVNPLNRRPVSAIARVNAASDAAGRIDNLTTQAALGLRWQATRNIAISAERLVSLGEFARDDWALRLAAGGQGKAFKRIDWSAYGEAAILGNGDSFAGGLARATVPLFKLGPASLAAGPGVWGSVQRSDGATLGRLDAGPTATVRLSSGRLNFDVSADYRYRITGNVEPGNGPAITVSTAF